MGKPPKPAAAVDVGAGTQAAEPNEAALAKRRSLPTLIRITARREGFRRAGIAHSTTPTVHETANLSHAQIDALFGGADSMLIIERGGD